MVRLENLTKEYDLPPVKGSPAQVIAADRLNLTIGDGEIFGFVGPNGAGKTTTLKMICGLLVPTSGSVEVNGIDVERRPEDAQRFLGYLSDFSSLYDDLKVRIQLARIISNVSHAGTCNSGEPSVRSAPSRVE